MTGLKSRTVRGAAASLLLVTLTAACAEDTTDLGPNDAAFDEVPDAGGVDEVRLIDLDYEIPAGTSDLYVCKHVTLTEDTIVTRFTPTSPAGVHHTVLAVENDTVPDGLSACDVLGAQWSVLFASGIDSPSLSLPDGIGFRIAAGQQIVLQLHLYNTSDLTLAGQAAVNVRAVTESEITDEAEVVFAGPIGFSIPDGETTDIEGECTQPGATNFFAVFPHMHKIGTHMQVWAETSDGVQMVHDSAYSFTDQTFTEFAPIPMAQGDKIGVRCTFENDTGRSVNFGDKSDDEMCFAISYRYPKVSQSDGLGTLCPY